MPYKKIINYLLFSLFLFFSLGMLTRISFYGQQINGYLYEFVMFFILLLLFFKHRFIPVINAYKNNKYLFWFFIFSFITYCLYLGKYSRLENIVGFFYQIRLFFYVIFFLYVKDTVPRRAIEIFIVLTVLASLTQYFLYPDLRNLIYSGWDPHLYRLFGVYFDTYVAVTIYGLIFFYLLFQKRTLANKMGLSLFLFFIIMTFSRTGYLAFLTTLLFVYIKKLKQFVLILSMAIIIFILLPKPQGEGVNLIRYFSIQSRITDYQAATNLWKQSPIIGMGYNRIRYLKINDLNSHSGASFSSSFMIILVTTGLIGFILFSLGFIRLIASNQLGVVLMIFVSLVSLADNALLHPFILFLTLSLLNASPSRR